MAQSSFKDNYKVARRINNTDMSHVQVIKSVNWKFSDAVRAQPNPSNYSPQSEIKTSYNYKGHVIPNKLPNSRIEDMKGTHFEIGNQSLINKLNSN